MAKAAEVQETLTQKIDRLGRLEGEVAPWKPKIKQAQDLRTEIAAAFDSNHRATEDGRLEGGAYFSIVGARKLQTKIKSMRAVLKAVGQALFLSRCRYTLEDLAADTPEYGSLVVEERTGSRDVKTYAKADYKAA